MTALQNFNLVFSHQLFSGSRQSNFHELKLFISILYIMLYIYLPCPPPQPFLTLSPSLPFALSNERKQCRCSIGSLFAKLNASSSGVCKSFGTFWSVYRLGDRSGERNAYTQLHTGTPGNELTGAFWLFGEGRRRFLSRACSGSRAFVRLTLNTGFTAW